MLNTIIINAFIFFSDMAQSTSMLLACLWAALLVTKTIAQVPAASTAQNPCSQKNTCHECIEKPSCAWCYDPVSS